MDKVGEKWEEKREKMGSGKGDWREKGYGWGE